MGVAGGEAIPRPVARPTSRMDRVAGGRCCTGTEGGLLPADRQPDRRWQRKRECTKGRRAVGKGLTDLVKAMSQETEGRREAKRSRVRRDLSRTNVYSLPYEISKTCDVLFDSAQSSTFRIIRTMTTWPVGQSRGDGEKNSQSTPVQHHVIDQTKNKKSNKYPLFESGVRQENKGYRRRPRAIDAVDRRTGGVWRCACAPRSVSGDQSRQWQTSGPGGSTDSWANIPLSPCPPRRCRLLPAGRRGIRSQQQSAAPRRSCLRQLLPGMSPRGRLPTPTACLLSN